MGKKEKPVISPVDAPSAPTPGDATKPLKKAPESPTRGSTDPKDVVARAVRTGRNTVAIDYSNEMMVTDVTMEFLYRPRSITALVLLIGFMFWTAFQSHGFSSAQNIYRGLYAAALVFFVVGVQVFPSGPFTRPHPAFWRIVFGFSLIYLIFLVIMLYQSVDDARYLMTYIDSRLNVPLVERSYAADCTFSFKNFTDALYDRYVLSHFLGWLVNGIMIRDRKILWICSILWEFIEITFTFMLPNFAECWWDQWILDVLICNGLGLEIGYQLCNFFEVQEYKWSGLLQIPTITGKLKRVVGQFSPQNWTKVRWEPAKNLKRFMAAVCLIIMINTVQLNAFFLKQLLWIPPENNLNLYRLLFLALLCAPTIRQYYLFVDRDDIKRLGMQCWVFLAIAATEFMCILKWSPGQFSLEIPAYVIRLWAILGSFLVFMAVMITTRSLAYPATPITEANKKRD